MGRLNGTPRDRVVTVRSSSLSPNPNSSSSSDEGYDGRLRGVRFLGDVPMRVVPSSNSSSQFSTGDEAPSVARVPPFCGGGIKLLRVEGPGDSVSWKSSSQFSVCCSRRKGVDGPGSAQVFSELRRSFV